MKKNNPNNHKSRFDPSRKTVGSTYYDLHKKSPADFIQVGDMNNELLKGFLEDVNIALVDNPFNDEPFYVRIVEEKDMQMKEAIHRGVTRLRYRPWPEDNTLVFWVDPKKQEIRFCWDLPHHSEILNIVSNAQLYPKEYIRGIIAWQRYQMSYFGFEFVGDYPKWSNLVDINSGTFAKEDIKKTELPEDLRKQIQEAGGWFPMEKQNDKLIKC